MNQNDREMIELAAKAAGYPWRGWTANERGPVPLLNEDVSKPKPRINCPTKWNPLEDDGDALRLAVSCRLFNSDDFIVEVKAIWLYPSQDRQQDVRRAIVRAAAEIGKSMESK